MFFDVNIKINLEELPSLLKNQYLELKGYYDTGDDLNFTMLVDTFEACIKNFAIENKITKKMQVDLFHVIGIY